MEIKNTWTAIPISDDFAGILGPRWGGIFDPGLTPRVGSSEGEPKVSEAKQGMKKPLQIGGQKPGKSSGMGIYTLWVLLQTPVYWIP